MNDDSQLDLFLAPGVPASPRLARKMRGEDRRARRKAERPSVDQRYAEFASKNPHVFAELLRLATDRLDRGETFISIKALWEELRTSLDVADSGGGEGAYKLNNDFTALYARALIRREPRLDGVIRLRGRK